MSSQTALSLRKSMMVAVMSASLWLALITVSLAAESISSFTSDIEVKSDSSFVVTETVVYDFGSEQRHGIYREIENRHAQIPSAWYKERYLDFSLLSVKRDGVAEPYADDKSEGLYVRIGDPDKTISGTHTYEITYTVRGGLSVYDDHVELYWNATGDGWIVPINDVHVNIRASEGVIFGMQQYCYAGVAGSRTLCTDHGFVNDTAYFAEKALSAGEQLTVAQLLILPDSPQILERSNLLLVTVIFALTWLTLLIVWAYRWRIQYRSRTTIVPQYEPYQNFKPMFTGVLFDNRLDTRDVSAGIVYLAQQGFLSIRQLKEKILFFSVDDYEVTLLRGCDETELLSHRKILQLLFSNAQIPGEVTKLSELRKSMGKRNENVKILSGLRKSIEKDLVTFGFLEQRVGRTAKLLGLFGLVFLAPYSFAFLLAKVNFGIGLLWLMIVLSGIVYLAIAAERRTAKGYEAFYYLQGFKDFLSVTEKDRYEFHNAPHKSPEQFMEFLPYAMAFGVEKQWAEVFKDVQLESPDWYVSATPGTFSASALNQSLTSFTTVFSSSSGSSGSSGSGSAGGGSGGGGGGSW